MTDTAKNALEHFTEAVRKQIPYTLDTMDVEALDKAAALIQNARANGNRIHVTGIGKPSYVAGYLASLMSSTGTPSYYLHGTEAVHGSCGQLEEGDVVIAISNSGETGELKATVAAVKNNGCAVIVVTGNPDSSLAKEADVCLKADALEEGGPLNRAPRGSILAEVLVLQCLSVLLQADRDWTPEEYVKRHPGGSLGKLRENEKH